jgi:hypothetical protein
MAVFAHKAIPGFGDDSSIEVDNEMVRVKDEGISKDKLYQGADVNILTATGVAATSMPNMLTGLTEVAETFADGSNDDVELGKVNVVTGNAVEGIIGDTGSATAYRITAVVNRSGGVILVTVTDETNMKINGQGKRLSIVDGGFCVLMETANDLQIMVAASGVTLVAYAT